MTPLAFGFRSRGFGGYRYGRGYGYRPYSPFGRRGYGRGFLHGLFAGWFFSHFFGYGFGFGFPFFIVLLLGLMLWIGHRSRRRARAGPFGY